MPRVAASSAQIGIYTTGSKLEASKQPSGFYIIDVAGLRDPGSSGGLRNKYSDGRPGEVQDYMREDNRVSAIIDQAELIARLQFEGAFDKNLSGWLSFVVRDHHGRWIAPAVGEILADHLSNAGFRVCCYHYGLGEK